MCRDTPCIAACEPGALGGDTTFAFGTARIFLRLCLNHGRPADDEEAPCERCIDWCPVAGAIQAGADFLPVVDAARCTGCGLCAAHCAAFPQAIGVH
jgi:ferredoxin-type protein NapG